MNERLFIAVMLPGGIRERLKEHLRTGVSLPGRVVPPESWHLTLRFLGDTPSELRSRLADALRRSPLGDAFPLALNGWGAFPRPARASVLWVGVARGRSELHRLAHGVEENAQVAGFPAERRPFSPHLTLARIRPPEDVGALLQSLPGVELEWEVEEVALVRSHLGGGPARYEILERFSLDRSKS